MRVMTHVHEQVNNKEHLNSVCCEYVPLLPMTVQFRICLVTSCSCPLHAIQV